MVHTYCLQLVQINDQNSLKILEQFLAEPQEQHRAEFQLFN